MEITCILCDLPFSPDSFQARRLQKHPYRIILCPTCNQRIARQTEKRLTQEAKHKSPPCKTTEAEMHIPYE